MKPIHSKDPRKPTIVAEMKRRLDCRKITQVQENTTAFYGIGMLFNHPGTKLEDQNCLGRQHIEILKSELNLLQTWPVTWRKQTKS